MHFLFPTFLIASLAIAIPILIHLFNFRRYKKVFFSNVAFLRSIQQASNSRRKINRWLVLAARCLAVLALVFAFAQPYFETNGKVQQGTNYSVIYLDNSFSMGNKASDGNLLEQGKETARQIVNGFGPDDKFQVITNDNEGFRQSWMNKDEALTSIDEKIISPQFKSMSAIFRAMQQGFKLTGSGKHNAYFISDFQKDASDLAAIRDTGIMVNLVPVSSTSMANVYIDTVYFKDQVSVPGVADRLIYKIMNDGSAFNTVKPVLKFNGSTKPLPIIELAGGKGYVDTVTVLTTKSGFQSAELVINDAPITFDDNYFLTWNAVGKIRVLVINDGNQNRYLSSALQASGLFEVTDEEITRVNYSRFGDYSLIIINEVKNVTSGLLDELTKALAGGANLAIFPGIQSQTAINQLSSTFSLGTGGQMNIATQQVSSIDTKDYVFTNVFEGRTNQLKLPVSQRNIDINVRSSKGAIPLLSYRSGKAFLVRYPRNGGQIFLCAAPLDPEYSDFVKNGEVLVPFLFKAGFSNLRKQLAFTIGRNESFEVNQTKEGQDAVMKFTGPQTFIPEQLRKGRKTLINTGRESILPGIYELENAGLYAFNYDRKESRMDFLTQEQLKSHESDHVKVWDKRAQANLASIIREEDTGLSLWRYLLVAALLLLLAETALLRSKQAS